ncbi:RNA 3-terminal phosphate cyclase [Gigaspora margarita]|uniref:RNA 3'-terminal-phosphate cyclase (ATP) n=1 Tax=Gigaspora margarita TaxID=4874 RepID=A0A8H3WY01_GIGMA|nr:RNA 3-terminal phosphate cyclase [Gigaspora margarita]
MDQETEFITLDGSLLEGGGQVLRNCVALSCLTNKPVRIINIRLKRDKPGLKPQHLSGLQLIRDIFKAELQGDKIGSKEILFHPSDVDQNKTFICDTKTAGSIALLIQIALPPLLFSAPPQKSKLPLPPRTQKAILKGGTNVSMAPPIDFLIEVFKPIVQREFGFNFDINVIGRGYYPQGGGEVILSVDPLVNQALKPLNMIDRGKIINIKGRVTIANSPKDVATKIISGVSQALSNASLPELNNIKPDIEINIEKITFGKGHDILLWAETSSGCIISGSAVSNRGQSPVDVGKIAAEVLLRNIKHGGCVDEYLQDQLIIFMAIAEGKSRIITGPITLHTRTAIHFAEIMSSAKFNITKLESSESQQRVQEHSERLDDEYNVGLHMIECEGIGIKIAR